jgi:hypothetical protein
VQVEEVHLQVLELGSKVFLVEAAVDLGHKHPPLQELLVVIQLQILQRLLHLHKLQIPLHTLRVVEVLEELSL